MPNIFYIRSDKIGSILFFLRVGVVIIRFYPVQGISAPGGDPACHEPVIDVVWLRKHRSLRTHRSLRKHRLRGVEDTRVRVCRCLCATVTTVTHCHPGDASGGLSTKDCLILPCTSCLTLQEVVRDWDISVEDYRQVLADFACRGEQGTRGAVSWYSRRPPPSVLFSCRSCPSPQPTVVWFVRSPSTCLDKYTFGPASDGDTESRSGGEPRRQREGTLGAHGRGKRRRE
jgi:hypothetical protein